MLNSVPNKYMRQAFAIDSGGRSCVSFDTLGKQTA
jgi:hypothetical protein